ncbi:MAG: GatB/YqeY domain-containing protein [Akkermansia sp.]|nr:GatB/YqeY domain-containing protein [Akkermansia sp.]
MSTISDQLTERMKAAIRSKDTVALNALRSLKAALTNARIEKGNLHAELGEHEEAAVVRRQIKQRDDAIEQFAKAGRTDLSEKEEAEKAVLSSFLPAEMTEEQIRAALEEVIAETGASSKKDMGRVMKAMQEKTGGRAPGRLLASLASTRLA